MPLQRRTRAVDPITGERLLDPVRRTWAQPATPELAVVQNVLRTPLGSAARDRSYGVEQVENATPNADAVWRQNVLRALKRWIDSGFLRDVKVTSTVRQYPQQHVLAYRVTFRGRDGRVQTFPPDA